MEAFSNEDNFTVWSTINNCIGKLSILLSHTDYDDLFKAYVRRLMQGVASHVGWDPRANESEYDGLGGQCSTFLYNIFNHRLHIAITQKATL